MVRAEEGSALYLYIKFEADSLIRSKFIRESRNFKIGSCDPGHAYLGVILWSTRRKGDPSISIPNSKRVDVRSEVIRGPKILKLGRVTSAKPSVGSVCIPCAGLVRPLNVYQI